MHRNETDIRIKKNWDTIYTCIDNNLELVLLVLHRYFGFGKKRIGEVIDCLSAVLDEFKEYEKDGVSSYKLEQLSDGTIDQRALGKFLYSQLKDVIPEEYHEDIFREHLPNSYEINAARKRKVKPQAVSLTEAAEVQSKIKAMKDFQREMKK